MTYLVHRGKDKAVVNAKQHRLFATLEAPTIEQRVQKDPNECQRLVLIMIKKLARDIGVKHVEEYDAVRAYDFLTEHFKGLTLGEIVHAFELTILGDLDQHFEQSSKGPLKHHYQTFNIDYIGRVLKSYMKWKSLKRREVVAMLPPPSHEWTEEMKAAVTKEFAENVCTWIDQHYAGENIDDYRLGTYLYEFLVKCGVCELTEEDFSKEELKSAYRVTAKQSTPENRNFMRKEFDAGRIDTSIVFQAAKNSHRREILKTLNNQEDKGERIKKLIREYVS